LPFVALGIAQAAMLDVRIRVDAGVIAKREARGARTRGTDARLAALTFVAAHAAMFVAGRNIDTSIAAIDHRRGTRHSFAIARDADIVARTYKTASSAIFRIIAQPRTDPIAHGLTVGTNAASRFAMRTSGTFVSTRTAMKVARRQVMTFTFARRRWSRTKYVGIVFVRAQGFEKNVPASDCYATKADNDDCNRSSSIHDS
jgi:hypothetical protein